MSRGAWFPKQLESEGSHGSKYPMESRLITTKDRKAMISVDEAWRWWWSQISSLLPHPFPRKFPFPTVTNCCQPCFHSSLISLIPLCTHGECFSWFFTLTVRVRGWFRSRFAPAGGLWPECFPCAGPQKTRLRRSNLRFACAGPQKMRLGRSVFPAHGHKKRVSGGQNLRFACAGVGFVGVCRGGVCVTAAISFGVCRGGDCVTALCRRRYIGVCRVICVKSAS